MVFWKQKKLAEVLTYAGVIIGGFIVLLNAWVSQKRVEAQEKNNELVRKGQLDTRFKDAATLLGSENTSSVLAGIYALHQIAVEAAETEEQKQYVKVVKEILCAVIRENSFVRKRHKISEFKGEYFERLPVEGEEGVAQYTYKTKPEIVFQTIVDVLFRNEGWEVYKEVGTNLKLSVLRGCELEGAHLENAWLDGAHFENANLFCAYLKNANLEMAHLENANLDGADLESAELFCAHLESAKLIEAHLENANLANAHLESTELHAYINEKTNFRGTIYEGKTIEEKKGRTGAIMY